MCHFQGPYFTDIPSLGHLISQESLLSEALDAVIKHLWESFETWKPEFPDLGSVHAVWIAVSFLVIAPVGSNSMSVILN